MPTQSEPTVEATVLSTELTSFSSQQAPTYAQLKAAMYSGRIPFTKLPNGRLAVRRADLPLIAETLGLVPASAPLPQPGNTHRALAEATA